MLPLTRCHQQCNCLDYLSVLSLLAGWNLIRAYIVPESERRGVCEVRGGCVRVRVRGGCVREVRGRVCEGGEGSHFSVKACSSRNSFLSALPPRRVRERVLPAMAVIW